MTASADDVCVIDTDRCHHKSWCQTQSCPSLLQQLLQNCQLIKCLLGIWMVMMMTADWMSAQNGNRMTVMTVWSAAATLQSYDLIHQQCLLSKIKTKMATLVMMQVRVNAGTTLCFIRHCVWSVRVILLCKRAGEDELTLRTTEHNFEMTQNFYWETKHSLGHNNNVSHVHSQQAPCVCPLDSSSETFVSSMFLSNRGSPALTDQSLKQQNFSVIIKIDNVQAWEST